MIRKIIIIGLFLIGGLCGCNLQADQRDFDLLCGYFTKLDKLADVDSMSNTQRNDFILDSIKQELTESSSARAAWIAIGNAVAEQRYELFQSAAESTLGMSWHCNTMKKWAAKTGEF
jgi:hypothetical protein